MLLKILLVLVFVVNSFLFIMWKKDTLLNFTVKSLLFVISILTVVVANKLDFV